jgi:hypothetical protein
LVDRLQELESEFPNGRVEADETIQNVV